MGTIEHRATDRSEIIRLCWDYGSLIDTEQRDAFRELFDRDVLSTVFGGLQKVRGPKEVQDYLALALALALALSKYGSRSHVMSGVHIDFDADSDPDVARRRATGVAFLHAADGQDLHPGPELRRRLRQTAGGWHFAERHHHVDSEYQTPCRQWGSSSREPGSDRA